MILPIEKPSGLADVTYNRLKQLILDTTLEPGKIIYEPSLAKSFKVSRTPVHWALVRLEQEGWIESTEGHGFLISPLTEESILEIYEMRILLEPRVARYFAELASEEQINSLIEPLEEIEAEIELGRYKLYFTIHRMMHDMMLEKCPNSLLKKNVIHMNESMIRIRKFTGVDPLRHVRASFDEQKRILGALSRRDAEDAECFMKEHLFAAKERVLSQLADTKYLKV